MPADSSRNIRGRGLREDATVSVWTKAALGRGERRGVAKRIEVLSPDEEPGGRLCGVGQLDEFVQGLLSRRNIVKVDGSVPGQSSPEVVYQVHFSLTAVS